MTFRVGISPCPNDVFIFAGWLLGRTPAPAAAFTFADVETLNTAARAVGSSAPADAKTSEAAPFDLVKASWANVADCVAYEPLSCGGALGRGCGPLLLTGGVPFDPEREVLIPGAHTTANFLLDFWHRDGGGAEAAEDAVRKPLRKRFLPFDALYRQLCADPTAQGVVIHEMRFTYASDGLRLVEDLGAAWERATGLPIPLGALLRRRDARIPSRDALEAAVRASLDWARTHEAEALELCARHAQDMTPEVMRAHIDLYVNAFSREMGEEGARAVSRLMAVRALQD